MLIGKSDQERHQKKMAQREWSDWFAWFPVTLDEPREHKGRTAWLHKIKRRKEYGCSWWEYMQPTENSDK